MGTNWLCEYKHVLMSSTQAGSKPCPVQLPSYTLHEYVRREAVVVVHHHIFRFSVCFLLRSLSLSRGCLLPPAGFCFGFLFVLLLGCNIVLLLEVASLLLVILVPSRGSFISSKSKGSEEDNYQGEPEC